MINLNYNILVGSQLDHDFRFKEFKKQLRQHLLKLHEKKRESYGPIDKTVRSGLIRQHFWFYTKLAKMFLTLEEGGKD